MVHAVSDQLELTIAVQHVLGIATGLLLYAAVRRLGAPVWAGVVAAAAVLLSLDQVFLEHALMTETLFTFLIVAAAYCALRALGEPRALRRGVTTRLLWIAAAGALLGATAWIRSYTVLLIPLLGLWLLLALPRPWRARLTGAITGVAVAPCSSCSPTRAPSRRRPATSASRAPAAGRCTRAPRSSPTARASPRRRARRVLCERTPPEQRPGPDFYGWEPGSPARRAFGAGARGQREAVGLRPHGDPPPAAGLRAHGGQRHDALLRAGLERPAGPTTASATS